MKTRFLSLLLIAVLAITTTVMAQQPKEKFRQPQKAEMLMKKRAQMKAHFDNFFTDEQKEKIKELRLETAQKVKPLRNELNELRAKQHTLTTADKADLKAINNNIDKMSGIKADIQKIMAKQHQEIRTMLTPEQLIKFDTRKYRSGKRNEGDFRRERMARPDVGALKRGAR